MISDVKSVTSYVFASNVRNLCRTHSIRIGELEDRLGVSHGYFSESRARRRKRTPASVLVDVMEIFDVSAESLLRRAIPE